ncbi:target of Nesh-SH3 isoform X10 [Paramormyrops kingsleyae]|uniref:target of Nesh-SH3 isoform X10 n=1 Tax=Paramormyrops kingsleyae TaxID=1676925 RepID=UPI000CD66470|nr:target of Nesh-SH3-like isoform X10 [Paramormyrops kingsleyae]
MLLGLPVDITSQSFAIRSAPERDPASLKCPVLRRSKGTMLPRPLYLLLAGILLISFSHAQQIRVRRQNMKVRINATGDTIVLKFVRPSPDMKLEGYILGYGSTMFSRQYIELPRDGEPYESEMDAEPKYLIAVQPIATNAVKKQCSGKMNLDKPLHLVIGTVSPTSVLLSWGTLLKTPYDGSAMNDCLEDGYYTVRYRERNRKWNYQTCPTSNTVIDNLKPNTPYEFGVRPSKNERMGTWSKSVLHNTGVDDKGVPKPFKPRVSNMKPVKPVTGTHEHLSPNGLQNGTLHTETAPVRNGFPSTPKTSYGSSSQSNTVPGNKKINQVGKPGDKGKATDLKQTDMSAFPKPNLPPATPKPTKQEHRTTTPVAPASNGSQFDIRDNSPVFSNRPISEVDAMGKKRFVAPHVIYKTDKKQDEPCSITTSLSHFSDEEGGEQNVTGPPKMAPSNLTVVTVEGCPSFIILDWDKTDNETTEYEVISTTKGPEGEEVSILTTNQTHTAVENLRPERSYEFKVKPKNELGEGPTTEPVSFNTESADPRVSENVSGKDAIWTQFPFKSDSYSECNGKQYVKRTWYRKFVGIQLCNSLRYKIYLSDSLNGKFYNIGDQTGHGEDHCQFVDSFLDGRTGSQLLADQLPPRPGYYRAVRQEPVHFGQIGGNSHISYVAWYECGTPIPGKW